jgi:hypothetical protein
MDLTLLVALFPNPPVLWFESTYSQFGRALNKAEKRRPDESSSLQPRGAFGISCPERIAEEYLRRCSAKTWKKENTIDSHKCFNLERILEVEMAGDFAPAPITLEDLRQKQLSLEFNPLS